jgi:hypothetical protein
VVQLGDDLTVFDEAPTADEGVRRPKRLVMLKGGHFEASAADFRAASGAGLVLEHLAD